MLQKQSVSLSTIFVLKIMFSLSRAGGDKGKLLDKLTGTSRIEISLCSHRCLDASKLKIFVSHSGQVETNNFVCEIAGLVKPSKRWKTFAILKDDTSRFKNFLVWATSIV